MRAWRPSSLQWKTTTTTRIIWMFKASGSVEVSAFALICVLCVLRYAAIRHWHGLQAHALNTHAHMHKRTYVLSDGRMQTLISREWSLATIMFVDILLISSFRSIVSSNNLGKQASNNRDILTQSLGILARRSPRRSLINALVQMMIDGKLLARFHSSWHILYPHHQCAYWRNLSNFHMLDHELFKSKVT